MPLSQAIILGVFPRRLHSFATAVWGMGVVCGPIIGPRLGVIFLRPIVGVGSSTLLHLSAC